MIKASPSSASTKDILLYAGTLNRRGFFGLLEAEILLKIATMFLLFPLGGCLWNLAFMISFRDWVTNSPLEFFTSPTLLFFALLLGLGLSIITLFESVLLISGLDLCHRKLHLRMKELFPYSLRKTRTILRRRENWPVLFFTAVLVPLSNGYMTFSTIGSLKIPEYIEEVVTDSTALFLLQSALFLLLAWLMFHWIFLLHLMILRDLSLKDAARISRQIIKGKRIRTVLQGGAWGAVMIVKSALCLLAVALPVFLVMQAAAIWDPELEDGINLAVNTFFLPAITYSFNVVLLIGQMEFLSAVFYYENGNLFGTLSREKRNWKHAGFSAAVFVLVAAGSIVFAFVAEHLYDSGVWIPEDERTIEITSHRGYSAVAPENTLAAISAAISSGTSDWAEIDVQMTSDGVIILSHDTTLKRCTGVDAVIAETPYEVIRKLDAGSFFSESYAGTKVPTLDEAIDISRGKIKLMIEIKSNPATPQLEAEVVRVIQENDFKDQCCVVSLDYGALEKVKAADPSITTGYILYIGLGNYYNLPAADFFSVESTFVGKSMVDRLHRLGKKVCVWTVDKSENAQKFIRLGVDNIITGDPPMVKDRIENAVLYLIKANRLDFTSPKS